MHRETIQELSRLCRIECSEADEEHFLKDLSAMLDYFNQLESIDTEGVKPLNHVLKSMINVMREDQVSSSLSRELFLENAPSKTGGMIRVPPILKEA